MRRRFLLSMVALTTACAKTYASAPEADAGALDAAAPQRLDAAVTDASGEAPTDAGDAGCPGFCDGFERSANDVKGSWTTLDDTQPSTSLSLDGEHTHTGASALHDAIATTVQTTAPELLVSLPAGAKTQATYTLWVYAPFVKRHTNLARLDVTGNATTSMFVVGFESGLLFAGRQATGGPSPSSYQSMNFGNVAFGNSQWHEIRITADVATTTPRVTLTLDGTDVSLQFSGLLTTIDGALTTVTASCGANFAQPGAPVDVWFDDVSLLVP